MKDKRRIFTFGSPGTNMIYAYTMPGIPYREGQIKIGQTRNRPKERIEAQTRTPGIIFKLEWHDYAVFRDGSGEFTDKDFHGWMGQHKNVWPINDETGATEIFELSPEKSLEYFNEFANRGMPAAPTAEKYTLRKEQQEAVDKTRKWFESDEDDQDFLWNAKPRFGKTLTSYALVQQMGFKKVLIVSNRPSISNSWAEDFYKFIWGTNEYTFVSDNEALRARPGAADDQKYKACVMKRHEFVDDPKLPRAMIAFESLQGLKGSIYFGGDYDKLKWICELEFDLLIVDESHEGVETMRTERAFDNIQRKHTLYLSGTPFRQLASAQFSADQIYNWSYADEQEAKETWKGPGPNPYARLPRLSLFTYQMSEIIRDKAQKGIILNEGEDAVDYAFDLNEFFLTNDRGNFVHEEDVHKFLKALSTQEKYPFSTPELRDQLSHTMWYLNRVASARALEKLLKDDDVFKGYKVVLAVGDANDEENPGLRAYDLVKKAIAENPKTITLTVGQLTVGVTIPEWSAVLMLCNMQSPSSYMQAAFRAQNPCTELVDGELTVKENAYVFDFDPTRSLVIFDEFATNLLPDTAGGGGTADERKQRIMRLLNFLPVIGEDSQGKMIELDAAQILSIPRRLKSQEVVRHGFMSNFLFQNIGNIFSAPDAVREIMEKLPTATEEKWRSRPDELKKIEQIPVNQDGEVEIPEAVAIGQAQDMFGEKIYGIIDDVSQKAISLFKKKDGVVEQIGKIGENLKNKLSKEVIKPVAVAKSLTKSAVQRIEKDTANEVDRKISKIAGDYEQEKKIAEATYKKEMEEAASDSEMEDASKKRDKALEIAVEKAKEKVHEAIKETLEKKPEAVIRQADTVKAQEEKKGVENEIRAHLRGFARTIPSFIMAYGDENLTLANFEQYVSAKVFEDVTGITIENFLFLRDGGEYEDKATGKREKFPGHLFDAVVFDDSIKEFLAKKNELKDYFREDQDEDIFDYIPPQKTNQIYTPRNVVSLMVDLLEKENPGCFDDPENTFADLYMKSGLYITEIVKRLFRSQGLKNAYPNDEDRIRHILKIQVYGLAPTEIIYRIATNFILGFNEDMKKVSHNFKLADTVKAAKEGGLEELVGRIFPK